MTSTIVGFVSKSIIFLIKLFNKIFLFFKFTIVKPNTFHLRKKKKKKMNERMSECWLFINMFSLNPQWQEASVHMGQGWAKAKLPFLFYTLLLQRDVGNKI